MRHHCRQPLLLTIMFGLLVHACSGQTVKRVDSGAPAADAEATGGGPGTEGRGSGGTVAIGATGGGTSSGGEVGSGGMATDGTVTTGGNRATGGGGGTGGIVGTGGVVGAGGSSAAGGGTAIGGRVGSGGGAGTGGVPATGGISGTGGTGRDASVDSSANAPVDSSIPSACGCTLVDSTWELPWGCLCAIRECDDTLSDYQADGGSGGVFWALEEYAGCGLAVVVQTSPQKDSKRFFDLTTGRLVGYNETVNGGISCPFGADAASTIFWLRAGQMVPTTGCVRSACIHGTGQTGYCRE